MEKRKMSNSSCVKHEKVLDVSGGEFIHEEENKTMDYEKIIQTINEIANKPTEYKYFSCHKKTTNLSNKDHRVIFDSFHKDRHYKLDEILYDTKTGVFTNRSTSPICLHVSFGFPVNNISEDENLKTWFCHSRLGNTAVCQSTVMHLMPTESFHCCFRQDNRHVLIIDQPPNAYVHICKA